MPNLPSWTEQTLEQKGSKTSEAIHDVNAHVNDLSAISGELPPL